MKQQIESKTLLEILTEYSFSIPQYQREYSWDAEKVDLLLDPLISDNFNSMFSGNIILKKGDKVDIIDGQQRIISYLIIFLAVYYKYYINNKNKFNDFEFIFEKIYSYEIIEMTNKIDCDSFSNIIKYINENIESKNKSKMPNKTLMEKAFINIQKRIVNIDFNEILKSLKNVFFSTFLVETEDEAIETFVVMNTRGKPLKKWDVIKSKFLQKHTSEERGDAVTLLNNIDINLSHDISKREYFLLFYLNSTSKILIKQKDIISLFSDLFASGDILDIGQSLLLYSIILKNIYKPTKEYWNNIYDQVYDISYFGYKQLFPLIGIIKNKHSNSGSETIPDKFHNVINDLFLYLVRTATISSMYGSEPRTVIATIKENLFNYFANPDNYKTFDYKEDPKFFSIKTDSIYFAMKDKTFETPADEKLAKWMLRKIYKSKLGSLSSNNYNDTLLGGSFDNITLEHIMDKSVTKNYFNDLENSSYMISEWFLEGSQNKFRPNEIFMIGNFTLLTKEDNQTLSTKIWKKWSRKENWFWGGGYSKRHLLKLEESPNGFNEPPKIVDRKTIHNRSEYLNLQILNANIFKYTFE